jgi:hypothetical protein
MGAGDRLPHDLRAAVVAAVRQGVTSTRLRSVCGVSTSQLDRWRAASIAGESTGAKLSVKRCNVRLG